ncbi:unnamed protein product [Prunus armeniaca]|uniref:Uncharacterized protein n=1 Tax=Prunus armeniaca TaxID=36596 RepID=A0A6J5TT54_PRUAR|nr:unnamed protein product [Prunus armeniaca]
MEKIAPLGNLKQLESGLDRAVYAESHPENKSERWQPEEFTHNHLKEVEIGGCKGTYYKGGRRWNDAHAETRRLSVPCLWLWSCSNGGREIFIKREEVRKSTSNHTPYPTPKIWRPLGAPKSEEREMTSSGSL